MHINETSSHPGNLMTPQKRSKLNPTTNTHFIIATNMLANTETMGICTITIMTSKGVDNYNFTLMFDCRHYQLTFVTHDNYILF